MGLGSSGKTVWRHKWFRPNQLRIEFLTKSATKVIGRPFLNDVHLLTRFGLR